MSGEVFGDGPLYEFDVASSAILVTAEEAQSLFDAPWKVTMEALVELSVESMQ
jgi:hypothetical protein